MGMVPSIMDVLAIVLFNFFFSHDSKTKNDEILQECAKKLHILLQVEKSFIQNEGGYKDGLELQQGKKQGVVTQ